MHFDTEEGMLYAHHEVVHPAVSSVLYLSDAEVRRLSRWFSPSYHPTPPANLQPSFRHVIRSSHGPSLPLTLAPFLPVV